MSKPTEISAPPPPPSRRDLLVRGVAGAIGVGFLPAVRRRAQAAPGPAARADRVLILNLSGGVRSSMAFHASPLLPYNPHGLIAGVAAPFALGAILDDQGSDASYALGGAWGDVRLPRLREIAGGFSVLGTYSTARGDHLRARIEEPTGLASGAAPGLLTRIGAGLAAAQTATGAPAFHLAPAAAFGAAIGELTRHVPVSIASHHTLPSASDPLPSSSAATGRAFTTGPEMADRLDAAAIAARVSVGRQVTETLSYHRRAARSVGARLAQPDFALGAASADGAALGAVQLPGGAQPLTNAMLTQLFRAGAPAAYDRFAVDLALAVRLLQIGSPAVVLETPSFDFHSGEDVGAPPLYGYLGRAWAALRWLLARVAAPGGGALLDRTLVVTMSDFGRDRAGASGYNAGGGSDHGSDYACFYLAHAIMGAGVRAGRLVGPADTASYRVAGAHYTPTQLLVTVLDALGLDAHDPDWGLPTGGAPIAELWS